MKKKTKNLIKKTTTVLASSAFFLLMGNLVSATPNNLHIIPESSVESSQIRDDILKVGNPEKGGTVIDRYNQKAEEITKSEDIWRSMQTWIMNWDTLINYVVYLMRFLSQLGLLIGGLMVLYAGYQYATTIFGYGSPNNAKTAIKNAVIWVIVVVASYAIWKGIISLFL